MNKNDKIKFTKNYNINTLDGLKKAEKAYKRLCNKYNKVNKVLTPYGYIYFEYNF